MSITKFFVGTGMLLCLEWNKGTATPTAAVLRERNLLGFLQSTIPLQGDFPQIPIHTTHGIKCHPCYPISLGFVIMNEVCYAPVVVPLVRERVLYWRVLECKEQGWCFP